MIQHSPHSGFSELIHDLWRNKPVFITVLVALGFGVYLLIKNSQNQAAASAPAQPATPTFTNLTRYVQENFIQPSQTLTMTQTQTVPTQPTPQPQPSSGNPIIPFSFFPTGQFPTIPGNPYANVPVFSYGGTTYHVQPGPNGKVYGTPVQGGQQVLLYGPQSEYH